MQGKKKMKRKEWTVIIAAITAAVMFLGIFMLIERKVLSSYDVERVVTAKTEIEYGTQITKENLSELFEVTQMQTGCVIEGAVVEMSDLIGQVVKYPIHKKEMVSASDLTNRQLWKEQMTDPIEFTFSATSISDAVAGSVRGGDVIDVGITYQREDGQAQYESVGQSIYVMEVYDDSGSAVSRSDKETVCTMFRVIMEKVDGEVLLEKLRVGDEVVVTLPTQDR